MEEIAAIFTEWKTQFAIIDLIATIISLVGIPWGLFVWYRARRMITIYVSCNEGERKGQLVQIGALPKHQATRSEIVGLITMKAGKERMDLSSYRVDQSFRHNKIVVPLSENDFTRWAGT